MILDFIVLRSGLPIYTMNFDPKRGLSQDQKKFTLISGFFSAISSFVDSVDNLGEVDEIQMSSDVFFSFKRSQIQDSELLIILIANQETSQDLRKEILKIASDKFMAQFDTILSEKWNGNVTRFRGFDNTLLEIILEYCNPEMEFYDTLSNLPILDNLFPSNSASQTTPEANHGSTPPPLRAPVATAPIPQVPIRQIPVQPAPIPQASITRIISPRVIPMQTGPVIPQQAFEPRVASQEPEYHDYEVPAQISDRFERYQLLRQHRSSFQHITNPGAQVRQARKANMAWASTDMWMDESVDMPLEENIPQPNRGIPGISRQFNSQSAMQPNFNRVQPSSDYDAFLRPQLQTEAHFMNSNMMGMRNGFHLPVYEMVPRKLPILAAQYRHGLNTQAEKMLFMAIDGRKTIRQLARTFECQPIELLDVCQELEQRGYVQLAR